jgi:uncharacterized protein YdaU (DUF1376 family)
MHYYQFNIGDYASHTRHLSIIEDIAYRRLLDLYYLHERPLGDCSANVARLIGMSAYQEEVETVLIEYFEHVDDGYINARADKEIAHYHSKIEQASKAGKASAERRSVIRSTDVQPNNKQETITNKQETKLEKQRGSRLPVDFVLPDDWIGFCQQYRKDLNPQEVFDAFKDFWISKPGAGGVKLDWTATWRNWVRNQKQSFAKQDIIHTTVPGRQERDPALAKLDADRLTTKPPSLDVLARLAALRQGAKA